MPPTFLLFLGFIVYIALVVISSFLLFPFFLIESTKLIAKKIIASILISFPCLIAMGVFWFIIFIIPALEFSWLANSGYIPRILGIVLGIIGLVSFVLIVAITSLYLWYFLSKIIYYKFDKKPINDFLANDRVLKFLRPFLIKLKLYPRW